MAAYKQVKLQNDKTEQVCWIESQYANKGWLVSLENTGGDWLVIDVYNTEVDHAKLVDYRKVQKEFASKLK